MKKTSEKKPPLHLHALCACSHAGHPDTSACRRKRQGGGLKKHFPHPPGTDDCAPQKAKLRGFPTPPTPV
jgi:hypothetical protein